MPLQLEIVSPERRAFTDEVDEVIVPGIDGQLGILPHHTRLITALGTGELRIKKGGTEQSLLISGGFVEVRPDKVIVICYCRDSGTFGSARLYEVLMDGSVLRPSAACCAYVLVAWHAYEQHDGPFWGDATWASAVGG